MTRWLGIALLVFFQSVVGFVNIDVIAFDMPYGVQDPLRSGKYQMCEGTEIGYWQIYAEKRPGHDIPETYLYITTVDLLDPAFVICIVPSDMKVMAMGKDKKT